MSTISSEMDVDGLLELLRRPTPFPLPEGWWEWSIAHEAHRRLIRELLAKMDDYPENFNGKGIVICAGGHRLFTNGYVCAKMLRHLGCQLPIQFWHFDDEIDETMRMAVEPLGVSCVNAHAVERAQGRRCRILNGWELKAFALLRSPYREVLMLDADNVPVVDPMFLFGTPQYRECGALFWPDYGRLDPSRAIWSICEVDYRDEPEFESGQCVVDKSRCWQALSLAMHFNEHSDFYYNHIHGDKDTFHMAFLRTGTPFAMPKRGIHSLDATMCQHDFQDRRIFQHRNLDKWQLDGANREIADFWLEDLCRYILSELRARWSGRVFWHQPIDADEATIHAQLANKHVRYHRVGYDHRVLELLPNGTIGEGGADCERFWSINRIQGQLVLTLLGSQSVTCHLTRENGVWKGKWLHHERMPIELDEITPVE
jgi:Mannosyltransferase putative